jgi:hypothetical protein
MLLKTVASAFGAKGPTLVPCRWTLRGVGGADARMGTFYANWKQLLSPTAPTYMWLNTWYQ